MFLSTSCPGDVENARDPKWQPQTPEASGCFYDLGLLLLGVFIAAIVAIKTTVIIVILI